MDFGAISWLAVALAAVAFFVLGGVWYAALFSKVWMRAAGVTEHEAAEGNPALNFGATLVLEIVAAIGLAALIGADATVGAGAKLGVLVGVLIVVPVLAVNAIYDQKHPLLTVLNGGYNLLGFAAMGAIIGWLQ